MQKEFIVRLTDQERSELTAVVKKLKGTSQKVGRAQMLLKADVDGPNWTDLRIAEAFDCRTWMNSRSSCWPFVAAARPAKIEISLDMQSARSSDVSVALTGRFYARRHRIADRRFGD